MNKIVLLLFLSIGFISCCKGNDTVNANVTDVLLDSTNRLIVK